MLKKRFASLFLVLAMVLGLSGQAMAVEISESNSTTLGRWQIKYFEDGMQYIEDTKTGKQITAVFKQNEDGNLCAVNLADYADQMNAEERESLVVKGAAPLSLEPGISPHTNTTVNLYNKEDSYVDRECNETLKLSPDFDHTISTSYSWSKTVSHSFGLQVGGQYTFTTAAKNAIMVGAGFSWNVQATTSGTMTATTLANAVPVGRKGFIAFSPYYNVTKGTLTARTITVETGEIVGEEVKKVIAKSPKKNDVGGLDGFLRVELV